MIRLELRSLGVVEETSTFLVVLHAPELARVLLLEVGALEGRAIAVESDEIRTPRPLTHQLTGEVVRALGARLDYVLIHRYEEGTFYAYLVLTAADGSEARVDCRPSDAIAVALHLGAPVYATAEVLDEAGQDEAEYEAEIARIDELMAELDEADLAEATAEAAETSDGPGGEAEAEWPTELAETEADAPQVRTLRWLTRRVVH
jgi:bifunctional DNase/RNase